MIDQLCSRLNAGMLQHTFASLKKNPVLCGAEHASLQDLLVRLNDYAALPRIIIRLLEKARKKAGVSNMVEVAEELALNLSEERGLDLRAEPHGIPHYEMLKRGLKKEFKFQPTRNVRLATKQFLQKLESIVNSASAGKVIGAVYALESSATPELHVVRKMLETIAEKRGQPLAPSSDKSLIWFIEIHTDTYEVDHESRLKNAIETCLPESDYADFESGFREVIDLMETWWIEMAKSA